MWANGARSRYSRTSAGKVYGIHRTYFGMVVQVNYLALRQMVKLIAMAIKEQCKRVVKTNEGFFSLFDM